MVISVGALHDTMEKVSTENEPPKTAKQLEKEAKKLAKLEKLKKKQEKQTPPEQQVKDKPEVGVDLGYT